MLFCRLPITTYLQNAQQLTKFETSKNLIKVQISMTLVEAIMDALQSKCDQMKEGSSKPVQELAKESGVSTDTIYRLRRGDNAELVRVSNNLHKLGFEVKVTAIEGK